LSATIVIQGAPNDTARIVKTTKATIQEDLVSMDFTFELHEVAASEGPVGSAPAAVDLLQSEDIGQLSARPSTRARCFYISATSRQGRNRKLPSMM
jgi:hypothetical protein